MMAQIKNMFEVFEEFDAVAPRNMRELKEFITQCRRAGRDELADYLVIWMQNVEKQIENEWTEL